MHKTLLWELFASLSTAELREFSKFVRSPFFNTRPQLVALFDYLAQCRENNQLPTVDGGQSAIILENQEAAPVKKTSLHLANSALFALLEKYLVYQKNAQDDSQFKISLAAIYRKRHLEKHFTITLREAHQANAALPWRHAGYFEHLNHIEWEQYQFDTLTKRTESFNLQVTSNYMDMAFVARKLQLACLTLSHQTVYKMDYRIGLLDDVLRYAETEQWLDVPSIGLYYHCYKFQADPDHAETHFTRFRTLLATHSNAMPPDELRTLYLLAINFGIKRINQLAHIWQQATLDLYKGALSLDLLLINGQISRFAFNNIIAIALRVGDLDWTEKFILDYKPLLERHWREASVSLGLARIAYARRDFKTALLNLQRSDYKDHINNLTAKTLQLKIYFEESEFDLLENHLSGMRNYIRRHTSIGYHRTNYGRIVQYTQKLMNLNFNDTPAVEQLRSSIAAEDILTEKEWLLEMLSRRSRK